MGAGFAMLEHRKEVLTDNFKLPSTCTVFQAEILAIKEAAIALQKSGKYKYVRFFVDSQAALRALAADNISSELVVKTVCALNEAGQSRTIILNWTKAHVGIAGIELADTLAKEGGTVGSQVMVKMPKSKFKNRIEDLFYTAWLEDFQCYEAARMGKCFYKGPDRIKAKHVIQLSRMKLARFIRIISGHNALHYFQSKVDPEISPLCRWCVEANETFQQLINDCPRFLSYRREHLFNIEISNDMKWSIQDLVHFSLSSGINEALEHSSFF